ncbi:MAG: hypothetical protein ACOC7N_04345 [Chloroflexota bacterium]
MPLLTAALDEILAHLRPCMPRARDEPEGLEEKVEGLRRARGEFALDRDCVYGIFSPDEKRVLGSAGAHAGGGGAREMGSTMVWTLLADQYATSPAASTEIEAFDATGRRIDVTGACE